MNADARTLRHRGCQRLEDSPLLTGKARYLDELTPGPEPVVAAVIPGAVLAILPKTGHMLNGEEGEVFNEAVSIVWRRSRIAEA